MHACHTGRLCKSSLSFQIKQKKRTKQTTTVGCFGNKLCKSGGECQIDISVESWLDVNSRKTFFFFISEFSASWNLKKATIQKVYIPTASHSPRSACSQVFSAGFYWENTVWRFDPSLTSHVPPPACHKAWLPRARGGFGCGIVADMKTWGTAHSSSLSRKSVSVLPLWPTCLSHVSKKRKEMLQKHKGCDSWGLLEVFCHMTKLCHSINAKSSQSLLTLPASYLFSASFAEVSEIFPRLFWLILVTSFEVIYNLWRRAWSSKKASYKCRHSGGLSSGGWLLN